MSVPLTASGRITAPYTVDGLSHKLDVFVRGLTAVGSSYNINTRATDSNDLDWKDASTALAATMSLFYGSAVSFADHVLYKNVSGIFIPIDFHAVTNTSVLSGYDTCVQATLVLRDLLFHKVKIVAMEPVYGAPVHYPSFGSMPNDVSKAFVKQFTPSHTVTNAPYDWVVGRGDQYLNASPFVGFTTALNRKTRRRRGLA